MQDESDVNRNVELISGVFFFSSRRRHTRFDCDWSSDVCSSDLLLAMSAIFGMSAFLELRKPMLVSAKSEKAKGSTSSRFGTPNGARLEQGRVESVLFFESHIGQPNKSIVSLSNGETASRTLVFEGDLRNALPVGKRVEVTSREDAGRKILLNVNYR